MSSLQSTRNAVIWLIDMESTLSPVAESHFPPLPPEKFLIYLICFIAYIGKHLIHFLLSELDL